MAISKEEFVARCMVLSKELEKLVDSAKDIAVPIDCRIALLDASMGAGKASIYAQADLFGVKVEETSKNE